MAAMPVSARSPSRLVVHGGRGGGGGGGGGASLPAAAASAAEGGGVPAALPRRRRPTPPVVDSPSVTDAAAAVSPSRRASPELATAADVDTYRRRRLPSGATYVPRATADAAVAVPAGPAVRVLEPAARRVTAGARRTAVAASAQAVPLAAAAAAAAGSRKPAVKCRQMALRTSPALASAFKPDAKKWSVTHSNDAARAGRSVWRPAERTRSSCARS